MRGNWKEDPHPHPVSNARARTCSVEVEEEGPAGQAADMGSSGTCQLCLFFLRYLYLYLGKDLGMQLPTYLTPYLTSGTLPQIPDCKVLKKLG